VIKITTIENTIELCEAKILDRGYGGIYLRALNQIFGSALITAGRNKTSASEIREVLFKETDSGIRNISNISGKLYAPCRDYLDALIDDYVAREVE